MIKNSLKFRLIFSAVAMLLVLLPAIGFTLNSAFEKHLIAAIENELTAQSYSILADTEYFDGQLVMPTELLDSQFNVIDSGLYALVERQNTEVTNSKTMLWHSPSALNLSLINRTDIFQPPPQGERNFYQVQTNSDYFVSSLSVSYSDKGIEIPITLHIVKNQNTYLSSLNAFRQQLFVWLLLIAMAFVVIQWAWLKWTLKPLNQLSTELRLVEQGDKENVQGNFPDEVKPVIEQLNHLLKNEQAQRLRYRNAMADLAHSLKTPLATIKTSDKVNVEVNNEVDRISNIIEHQLKKAQTAGESAWRLSVDIEPIIEKLVSALTKIYRDKQIIVTKNIVRNCKFRGDEADLMEVLGNILDNAFKAADKNISIQVTNNKKLLEVQIGDDGKGIKEVDRKKILQRGVRADTYQQGHGIGLAIVRDIVDSYKGQLIIERDSQLNGAAFIIKFPAS
ncbi:GHKL domain-containing protein [Thalassotalea sp. M1531]|uniref:histidine kinase n=1 Tax=Thalassotalea algicola TaxID=2716224 RepID=A0A7Y0Q6C0_9GAMM|nr:ATP-binding protein [Thalassotalea algicola]NMP31218.1 GHKL domain-containing protein [Thalassotalea algicola]